MATYRRMQGFGSANQKGFCFRQNHGIHPSTDAIWGVSINFSGLENKMLTKPERRVACAQSSEAVTTEGCKRNTENPWLEIGKDIVGIQE